ncbi:hypothetical protein RS130_23145 [Paraglaciecola aquimarina]|uniref:Uncharacterized protein n=1 Tax=Paraglaciecola aquimarina TaxID=1235557 RepID=A0ABU3T2B5_9ALTE|nr:hypothetical protein [Paraglaciecola aquimarina]MDU0356403.1 hypothetical protein [Paraglaciecola aquimarina]
MKVHIFIATTQGLVAIQNITAIDDPDIRSVVSVNGTSTTANISSSYHNFVKKGVGIIQQMFGACSYRVDISARIDQGNSWQVAIYLAHLAQTKNMLGNGNVQSGDHVICATGEVNTTNHQILAVGQIATKYQLAKPLLAQWKKLASSVKFLLPLANQVDLKHDDDLFAISSLKQAAAMLPNSTQKIRPSSSSNRMLVSTNFIYISLFTLLSFAVLMYLWSNQQPEIINSQTPEASSASGQNIQMRAWLKQHNACPNTTNSSKQANQLIALAHNTFADIALGQVCKLTVQTDSSLAQLLLVAQDAYTVFPLSKGPQGWDIPLPKNRSVDRSYFIVLLKQKLSDDNIEQLRLYRESMAKPELLTEQKLSSWLTKQKATFRLYSHKLLQS